MWFRKYWGLVLIITISVGFVSFAFANIIGIITFSDTIPSTYKNYTLVASGYASEDCVDLVRIGDYSLPRYCDNLYAPSNDGACSTNPAHLLSHNCEYLLYKGWYFGIYDFYYVVPR